MVHYQWGSYVHKNFVFIIFSERVTKFLLHTSSQYVSLFRFSSLQDLYVQSGQSAPSLSLGQYTSLKDIQDKQATTL